VSTLNCYKFSFADIIYFMHCIYWIFPFLVYFMPKGKQYMRFYWQEWTFLWMSEYQFNHLLNKSEMHWLKVAVNWRSVLKRTLHIISLAVLQFCMIWSNWQCMKIITDILDGLVWVGYWRKYWRFLRCMQIEWLWTFFWVKAKTWRLCLLNDGLS
jgi:hypothetical protein